MAKIGRPPIYTEEQRNQLSDAVLESMRRGIPLGRSCKAAGVPKMTFLDWKDRDESLAVRYAMAREEMMDHWSEEVLDITEEETTFTDAQGVTKYDGAHVQDKRLRVDSRKWLLSKMRPGQYGEKVTQEHVGANGGPINFNNMNFKGLSDKELDVLQKLLEKAEK